MKVEVYNKENKKIDTVELSDRIFGAKWNPVLVHQVFVSESANRRRPYASTKDRSEVRGGGRKPWAQKGLGRARHGSTRSPIWAGGGVTHGPRPEKDYGKKINKKMKRAAVYSALSKKVSDGEVKIIDDLNLAEVKTKNFVNILKKFFKTRTSLLVVPKKENKGLLRAVRNIPKTKAVFSDALSVSDCLTYKNVFFEKEAVKEIS
ncbi:50S ribosomal protein L4 [Candidatus Jorgensenbacteria bacterium GWA1_49_17]|uniref:Large ribosomal subunit protein uL4 n=2 Tax=Candidatus Joergenseniibacteriota TaxID=1752739 RepID=A0A1F6BR23_9BACT|nr:MAG: 50S ribosomal protein L4 [Candidatus Jorgensenbacteria bacterium GWC1_48_12]OGG40488.1 MAG: 50S ribosomal protein L4 [Candidatus Jorgensenbacteria bacterium GWA1_49_17]